MRPRLHRRVLGWFAILALALPLAITMPTNPAEASVPTGFQINNYRTGMTPGEEFLTDFEFTPDNGFFSLGKRGTVNWTSPEGAVRNIHRFTDLRTHQDLGAISLTLGHRYGTAGVSPSVWIVRIRNDGTPNGESILSEFPVRTNAEGQPTGLGPERRVLWFANRDITHSMNDVVVDPRDGTLWVSSGDSADFTRMDPRALDAQSDDSPYGRIMHMDREGAGIAATNPRFDPANSHAWYSKTYAKGFRNPFRLRLHPTLGIPMAGDVGWNTTEEQNVVRSGGNYGWPCWEGVERAAEYRDQARCAGVPNANPPIFSYGRPPGAGGRDLPWPASSNMGSASVAGLIYQGESYPESYKGSYFWADYSGLKIFNMRMNAAGTALETLPTNGGWANNDGSDASRRTGSPVSLKYAPNGDITYADILTNQVRRITYSANNHAPVISTAQYETINRETREVAFSVTATDLDEDLLTYRWEFGDGTTSTEQNPRKTYSSDGQFNARVTVSDGTASTRADILVVPGNRTPELTLTTPPDDRTYAVGEEVRVTAVATDEDQPGEELEVHWTSVLYHCSGDFYCHRHPGAAYTGPEFVEPFTDHGDTTSLEIRAQVTDSAGVTVYKTWEAKPKLRNLTVTSNMNVPISVNGVIGGVRQVTVGSTAGISVPDPYEGVEFGRWSDGVTTNSRELQIADRDYTLEAIYNSPIAARYAEDAVIRDILGAPVGPETGDATGREQQYENGQMHYSPSAGVHAIWGAIRATYQANGGMAALGVPTNDESTTRGEVFGRFNTFEGTPANPAPAIYWTPGEAASLVMGSIAAQYRATDAELGPHRFPRTSEQTTPNGRAQYNDFQNGGIYWSGTTGARSVYGAIYESWARLGWETSVLGLPTTSEGSTVRAGGRFNDFEQGTISYSPATGAHEVRGSIFGKYRDVGREGSVLAFPTTDELGTPDRVGRFNHFQGGSIYWSPGTGAHEIHGLFRETWANAGWERSSFGYPTSDEFAVPGGVRQNFQRGYMEWSNGRFIVVR